MKENSHPQPSIFFYTFHKTASSFFNHLVLPNLRNLQHIDYESQLYQGKHIEFKFEKYGCIYGPFRVSSVRLSNKKSPMYPLASIVNDASFINDKTCIFFIRDPRDILVSAYYSFKHSHTMSADDKMRKIQLEQLKILQDTSIDQWVLSKSLIWKEYFDTFDLLATKKNMNFLLKYEDMINNWDKFLAQLNQALPLKEGIGEKIYLHTRPNEVEDILQHKRSGKTEGFREKLLPSTIEKLNEVFLDTLNNYGYPI